jgi:membrane protease YdiL (CAAX protease family)
VTNSLSNEHSILSAQRRPRPYKQTIGRHPVAAFFLLTFLISWIGAFAVAAPQLIHHRHPTKMTGLLMFPVMLVGPCIAGIVLTSILEGARGLRRLFAQMSLSSFPARWYAALLVPPVLILTVLLCLERFVSSAYEPNRFFVGILFGIPAGFMEEIGWTGYALPKIRSQSSRLAVSLVLGIIWSLWHIPVVDYLGTASPHGAFWLPFLLAFTLAMTAMRVLIAWIYSNTHSLLSAQLMHVSSTGSLVVFSPTQVTAAQEVRWYALYGLVLWIAVAIVVKAFGKRLGAVS